MQVTVHLPQEHLPKDHPLALRIRDRFLPGRELLTVTRGSDDLPVAQCYENVRSVVVTRGGRPQLGWCLSHFPNKFVEALHHAVWEDPNGNLVDVTAPAYQTMKGNEITFIPDNSTELSAIDPQVPSWFIQLDVSSATKGYIRATRERKIFANRILDILAASDVRLYQSAGQIATRDPIPSSLSISVQALQNSIAEMDTKRHSYASVLRR
ncbi:hypothetical protein [Mesorhizobium sp. NPDC059025]|uniref:hypothetical protein n=1 Tax=unclassified Mesorhizobium TaxID=325217 RepID=UPI00368CDBFB